MGKMIDQEALDSLFSEARSYILAVKIVKPFVVR